MWAMGSGSTWVRQRQPVGLITVGNGRSAFIGDALANAMPPLSAT
jgi:hypothetical protein